MYKTSANAFEKLVSTTLRGGNKEKATTLLADYFGKKKFSMRKRDDIGALRTLWDKESDTDFLASASKQMMRHTNSPNTTYAFDASKVKNKLVTTKNSISPVEPWQKGKIDPETDIDIAHGGGKHFLDRAFKGNAGYKIEGHPELKGIQVHPFNRESADMASINNRISHYAKTKAPGYFDTPATLTGKIKAKYLVAQPNGYEAGIPTENLKFITDRKISPVLGSNAGPAGDLDIETMRSKYLKYKNRK